MENVEDRVYKRLAMSINIMREACESANREINSYKTDPLYSCERVLHMLTWGFANANSDIETAIETIRRNLEQKE